MPLLIYACLYPVRFIAVADLFNRCSAMAIRWQTLTNFVK